jgi:hypothetical protein
MSVGGGSLRPRERRAGSGLGVPAPTADAKRKQQSSVPSQPQAGKSAEMCRERNRSFNGFPGPRVSRKTPASSVSVGEQKIKGGCLSANHSVQHHQCQASLQKLSFSTLQEQEHVVGLLMLQFTISFPPNPLHPISFQPRAPDQSCLAPEGSS